MDDAKKEQPKTYPLEEILACTKSDSEDIFPSSGANDWIENPTRFKLGEAKYFYKQLEEKYNDYLENYTDKNRTIFLFSLGAFFSATRSITFYMQKQYKKENGFCEWYCPQQNKMKNDIEMRFLNDLRVNVIHFCSPIVHTEITGSYQADIRLVYSEGDPRYGTPFPERIPMFVATPRIKATRVIFKAGQTIEGKSLPDDTEVIPFCFRQLSKLVDCTPDSRQLVKQRYLKQTPFRTVLEIYSQELNAASSCCTPSQ